MQLKEGITLFPQNLLTFFFSVQDNVLTHFLEIFFLRINGLKGVCEKKLLSSSLPASSVVGLAGFS